MEFAPSILSFDFSKFEEQLEIINSNFKYIHFDVMDGNFVPNISFGQYIYSFFRKNSNLFMDVHLMVKDPMKYVKNFINIGVEGITFHFEALNNIDDCKELIHFLHQNNVKAGISVKPNTDIKEIESLLANIDLVLVMSVEPGFGGQKFIDSSLDKVDYLYKYRKENNLNYLIEIDGGINDNNALKCKMSGVDISVVGSYLFNGNILDNILKLKSI